MTHTCVKQYSGVNSVPQIHVHPEPQNVIFGDRVFADVMKVRIQMR